MTKFFEKLAEDSLPVVIYQTDLIDQVRRYVSAGLVTANLPIDQQAKTPAQVRRITAKGMRVLRKHVKRSGFC